MISKPSQSMLCLLSKLMSFSRKSPPTTEFSEFSFVDNFIDEMKQSGYSNKEISMYLRDVLGRYEGLEVTLPDGSKGIAK